MPPKRPAARSKRQNRADLLSFIPEEQDHKARRRSNVGAPQRLRRSAQQRVANAKTEPICYPSYRKNRITKRAAEATWAPRNAYCAGPS